MHTVDALELAIGLLKFDIASHPVEQHVVEEALVTLESLLELLRQNPGGVTLETN